MNTAIGTLIGLGLLALAAYAALAPLLQRRFPRRPTGGEDR